MAKSYTLSATGNFTLTDNLSQKIFDFSNTVDFSSLSPDAVQFGQLEFSGSSATQLNLKTLGPRYHMYIEDQSTDNNGVIVLNGTTPITTIHPGEFIYTTIRSASDLNVRPNGNTNQRTIKYFIING
jgi:hypothetical protein